MILRTALATAAVVIITSAAVKVHAQRGDLISFPKDYAKGVLYGTVDRADLKQVRQLYANSQAAVDAAKAGKPLPDGVVITMVQYAAQVDGEGNAVKGADGRFIKTDKIVGYTVMEKRPGWGKDVPEDIRNGDWQYQAFLTDQTPNPKAQLAACFKCHKPLDKQDFLFSWDVMRGTAATK
jgi:Cytochrome P460